MNCLSSIVFFEDWMSIWTGIRTDVRFDDMNKFWWWRATVTIPIGTNIVNSLAILFESSTHCWGIRPVESDGAYIGVNIILYSAEYQASSDSSMGRWLFHFCCLRCPRHGRPARHRCRRRHYHRVATANFAAIFAAVVTAIIATVSTAVAVVATAIFVFTATIAAVATVRGAAGFEKDGRVQVVVN